MKLTTTLNLIRACSPCSSGWRTLNEALGSEFDSEEEINLLKILDTNGVQDMLWCLRATKQDSRKIASQLAIEFAEQAIPIFEERRTNDLRPRKAIQAARDFNAGKITREELMASRRDADAAAYAADADADAAAAAYADTEAAYADAAANAANAAVYAAAAAYADAANAADAADAAVYAATYAAAATAAVNADATAYADAKRKAKEKQAEITRSILEA